MDAQAWLMLVLGLLAGGGVGFALGRFTAPEPAIARAIEKEDAADAKADQERTAIEQDLAARIDETRAADAQKLKQLLDDDFGGGMQPTGSQPAPDAGGKPAKP